MVVLYALMLVAGFFATVVWLLADALAANPLSRLTSPIRRFGALGRDVMLGSLGFGMGGMSASFAGWQTLVALLAAAGGAAFVILAARLIGDGDVAA